METGYVVLYIEHRWDGQEHGSRCFPTQKEALDWINDNRWGGANYTYRLFHLGKQILLTSEKVEEQIVEKVTVQERTVYKVK